MVNTAPSSNEKNAHVWFSPLRVNIHAQAISPKTMTSTKSAGSDEDMVDLGQQLHSGGNASNDFGAHIFCYVSS